MPEPPAFVAAVLTGGASRRMGRDKAAIEIEGVPMASRVVAAARAAGATEVVVVGAPLAGEVVVPDDHPGEGPLGALLTVLRWAGDRTVVVLGCDLVEPSPAAIRHAVVELTRTPGHDVAVPVVGGREQWLHAAWWPPGRRDDLETSFAAGERSIVRATAGIAVLRYDEHDGSALADADLPEDLPPGAR